MFEKIGELEQRFIELEEKLAAPGLGSDELRKLSTERANIEDVVTAYREYRHLLSQQEEAKELLTSADDAEMKSLAKEELVELEHQIKEISEKLTVLSLPKDPNDDKNVYLEIRAGTGGEEAALFASDLLRMYSKYANSQGWRTEVMSMTEASAGGIKEAIMLVSGQNVYSKLKFESGTHRVQRVPSTESQGRVHTSACTVAVLPEAEDVDIEIDPKDLEIKVCRASGAGGQHVNTTDSAVRIVHLPTGIAVECQDERSQHKNKDKAMKVLKARLYDKAQQEQMDAISADRKSQVGSGDRSERIRTYNFPQGRITDHRINLTLYKLDQAMEGEIGEVVDALVSNHIEHLLNEGPGR